jgi:hypothetical protein
MFGGSMISMDILELFRVSWQMQSNNSENDIKI